jgi:hypothetical protein
MLFMSVDLCVPHSFVRCICPADCPPEQAKPLFLEYAALEEQHGLARHAMQVRDGSEQKLILLKLKSRYLIFTSTCVCVCMLACICGGCALHPTSLA